MFHTKACSDIRLGWKHIESGKIPTQDNYYTLPGDSLDAAGANKTTSITSTCASICKGMVADKNTKLHHYTYFDLFKEKSFVVCQFTVVGWFVLPPSSYFKIYEVSVTMEKCQCEFIRIHFHRDVTSNYRILLNSCLDSSATFSLEALSLASCSIFLGVLGLAEAFLPVWGLEEPVPILRWIKGLLEPFGFVGINKDSVTFNDRSNSTTKATRNTSCMGTCCSNPIGIQHPNPKWLEEWGVDIARVTPVTKH